MGEPTQSSGASLLGRSGISHWLLGLARSAKKLMRQSAGFAVSVDRPAQAIRRAQFQSSSAVQRIPATASSAPTTPASNVAEVNGSQAPPSRLVQNVASGPKHATNASATRFADSGSTQSAP